MGVVFGSSQDLQILQTLFLSLRMRSSENAIWDPRDLTSKTECGLFVLQRTPILCGNDGLKALFGCLVGTVGH